MAKVKLDQRTGQARENWTGGIDIGEPDLSHLNMSFISVHADNVLREADKGLLVLKLIERHTDRAVRFVGWVGGGAAITPTLNLGRMENAAWADEAIAVS